MTMNPDSSNLIYSKVKVTNCSLKSSIKNAENKAADLNFQEILNRQYENELESKDIRFSAHAKMRLENRNINLSEDDISRIQNGFDKAEEKGSKDSLILKDDVALLVNIKNKTVITAFNKEQLKENVFTNIDSAVIV